MDWVLALEGGGVPKSIGKEENVWRFPVARAPEEQVLEASTGMGVTRKNSDGNVEYLLGMLHRKYGIKAMGAVRFALAGGWLGGTVKEIITFGQLRHMPKTRLEEPLSLLPKKQDFPRPISRPNIPTS